MCPRAQIQHGTKLLEFGAKSIVAKQSFKNLFPSARERGYTMVLGFEKLAREQYNQANLKNLFPSARERINSMVLRFEK